MVQGSGFLGEVYGGAELVLPAAAVLLQLADAVLMVAQHLPQALQYQRSPGLVSAQRGSDAP